MADGYLHVYTGDGKGKTTAAIGLSIRAAGAGMRVFFGQFVKGMEYSECTALRRFEDLITIRQYGRGCFLVREADPADASAAREGLADMASVLREGAHGLVVLDEACIAVRFGLFTGADLLDALQRRAPGVEAVVTGRSAPSELLDAADLVTEMREVKHYYARGVLARTGIER
jgi:cob(I)alamin adenosyltransferase